MATNNTSSSNPRAENMGDVLDALSNGIAKTAATCYGPQGANIHGVDEWVSLTSLEEVTAVLALFIARWCGLNRLKV